jgi:acetyl-CoA synthetase
MTMKWVFDLKDDDVYWCSADIGWVTGHTTSSTARCPPGATRSCTKARPTIRAGTAGGPSSPSTRPRSSTPRRPPSARCIKQGDQWPAKHDLSSLRLLGSVGEPINPAAWEWYHRVIGGGRCPIVDTWWQTETGGILIAPMPGAVPLKPGSGTLPMPGILPRSSISTATPSAADQEGFLIIKRPWPA